MRCVRSDKANLSLNRARNLPLPLCDSDTFPQTLNSEIKRAGLLWKSIFTTLRDMYEIRRGDYSRTYTKLYLYVYCSASLWAAIAFHQCVADLTRRRWAGGRRRHSRFAPNYVAKPATVPSGSVSGVGTQIIKRARST